MKGRNTPIHPWLAGLALLAASSVQAASQGQLAEGSSASSSGSLQVGLVVPELVRLGNVDDLVLNWDAGANRFVASDGLCVYRNISGNYSVTASSDNGAGSFRMTGDGGSSLPYDVQWNGQSLAAGQRSPMQADADRTSLDCGGGSNIVLGVSASTDQVGQASRTGLHTDTLTLQVIAE